SSSIIPISGRICSWVRSKSCSPVLACTKRAVVEPRRLVIIRPSLPKLDIDNLASGAGFPYLFPQTGSHLGTIAEFTAQLARPISWCAMSTRAIRGLQHRQQSNHGSRTLQSGRIGLATRRWLRGGFAVASPSGSIASRGNSSQVAQLLQAMAGFGGSSGAADGLNAVPLGIADAAATWAVTDY